MAKINDGQTGNESLSARLLFCDIFNPNRSLGRLLYFFMTTWL